MLLRPPLHSLPAVAPRFHSLAGSLFCLVSHSLTYSLLTLTPSRSRFPNPKQHTERITGICIDRYGDFVATCSDDGKVRLQPPAPVWLLVPAGVPPASCPQFPSPNLTPPQVIIRNLYEDSNVQTFSFDRPIRVRLRGGTALWTSQRRSA